MDSGNRYVVSVDLGTGRDRSFSNQRSPKSPNFLSGLKSRNVFQGIYSLAGGHGIPKGRFGKHELGDIQIECGSPLLPPLRGNNLVCGYSNIPALSRNQVTRNRCLYPELFINR